MTPEPNPRYPLAGSPFVLKGVQLRNRIVRTAHGTNFGRGSINDRLIEYHLARARGGVALSILEVASVHPSSPGGIAAHDDGIVDGYARIAAAVHAEGMALFQQLWHGGSHARTRDGTPSWAPSPVPNPVDGNFPTAMTQAMIDDVVAGFASAARRCADGGLDGVEVHAAHSYLVGQFLSPVTNRRADGYGGDAEQRMRLLREILVAVRVAVGDGFPVGVRLSASEEVTGGLAPEDTRDVAVRLCELGLVDFVNLSHGSFYAYPKMIGAMHEPVGYQLPAAEVTTRAVPVPTIAAGRFMSLADAEAVLASGAADLVSIVRGSIADPELVAKSLRGRADEVRPCISCNQGCVAGILGPRNLLGCAVNVDVGLEHLGPRRHRATSPRRVLVAGAGPAGLEAARVAAARGHLVEVHEAGRSPGGAVAVARRAPGRESFGRHVDWQLAELARAGVPVHLGSHVDRETVRRMRPDVLVVATGATARRDGFQHRRPAHVVDGTDRSHVVTPDVVLLDEARVSGRVVVFDDLGTYPAIAAAEHLLARGASVLFATSRDGVGEQLGLSLQRDAARQRLHGFEGFDVLSGVTLERIGASDVELRHRHGGAAIRVAATLVVLATGFLPRRELEDSVAGLDVDVLVIGDAAAPRDLVTAIADGDRAGRSV